MPNATATQVKKSNNPFDIFITGLRKGFNVAINNLMPNVLMAFVLAYILDLFGVMAFLGKVCGPVMSIFDPVSYTHLFRTISKFCLRASTRNRIS